MRTNWAAAVVGVTTAGVSGWWLPVVVPPSVDESEVYERVARVVFDPAMPDQRYIPGTGRCWLRGLIDAALPPLYPGRLRGGIM